MWKYCIVVISFLVLPLVGCGSVDSNGPEPLNGSWHGVILENGIYTTKAYLHAVDNDFNGYAVVENTTIGFQWFFDVYGTAYGTEKAFGLNLQFSDESYDKWVLTGYKDGYNLCLSLEEGEPYCLEPISGPPATRY